MDYSVTHFSINTADQDVKQTSRELLADLCAEYGYESFEDTEEGIDGYIQTFAYSEQAVQEALDGFYIEDVVISFSTEEIETKDWNEAWEEQGFEPIRVGERCIIYDAKSDDADILKESAEISIAIDAKMAFGTGTHETTQMIVTEVLGMDMNGKRVLDCGCGTGILSLVAKACGADHVTAYDIDEWSVDNTAHNAEINNIELVDILLGDVSVLTHVDGVFDVIMANINRNIIVNDLKEIIHTLAPNGKILLSGFYEPDAEIIMEEAERLGLKETKRNVTNDWTMLCLERL